MKSKDEYVRDRLRKAQSDMNAASWCMNAESVSTDVVCFHCQQAAEKALKGGLVWDTGELDPIHDLKSLPMKCLRRDPSFGRLRGIETLTPYAVDIRYPDDLYFPTLEETKRAVELASDAMAFVKDKLKATGLEIA